MLHDIRARQQGLFCLRQDKQQAPQAVMRIAEAAERAEPGAAKLSATNALNCTAKRHENKKFIYKRVINIPEMANNTWAGISILCSFRPAYHVMC